jgi:hypothetical protein
MLASSQAVGKVPVHALDDRFENSVQFQTWGSCGQLPAVSLIK